MYSEKAGLRNHTFQRAHNHCHLCSHNGPAHSSRPRATEERCLSMESDLTPPEWSADSHFPPQEMGRAQGEERSGDWLRRGPDGRRAYAGPRRREADEDSAPGRPWERSPLQPNWRPEPCLRPGTCVRDRHGGWGGAGPRYYPESHPFNGNQTPLPLAELCGHCSHREACYEEEESHWGSARECSPGNRRPRIPARHDRDTCGYNGLCKQRHVSFQTFDEYRCYPALPSPGHTSPTRTHWNGPSTAHKVFFSTEVPPSQHRSSRGCGPGLQGSTARHGEPERAAAARLEADRDQENQRQSQATVKQQITQVVSELEEVLGGLKQVQLEMKEVVQQIDVLTSNIDLGEEEAATNNSVCPEAPFKLGHEGVMELTQDTTRDHGPPVWDTCPPLAHAKAHLCPHGRNPAEEPGRTAGRPAVEQHKDPSAPLHSPCVPEPKAHHARIQSTAVERQWDRTAVNGECVQSRPPRMRVKEIQQQRSRGDLKSSSKTLDPPFPLELSNIATKNHTPPPYPQNGPVKTSQNGAGHPPNAVTSPAYPGKYRLLSSTVV